MAKKKLVVAGAVGVIGRTVIAHFDTLDDWSVVGLSRSKPDFPMKAEHVSVDLLDAAASLKTLGGIKGATHAVFAALQWTPDLAAQVAPNRELVVNLIKGLEDVVKPPPSRQLEALHGGWGVMCDDFMAAIYAHLVLRGLCWLWPG